MMLPRWLSRKQYDRNGWEAADREFAEFVTLFIIAVFAAGFIIGAIAGYNMGEP